MAAKRDEATTVAITLRIKEDLRQALEESARTRGVSLNSELVTRLEHTRDRASLTTEVLSLTFGARVASTLVLVGAIMHVKGLTRGGIDWANDPASYEAAIVDAIDTLKFLLPGGSPPRLDEAMFKQVVYMVDKLAGGDLEARVEKLLDKHRIGQQEVPKRRRK
jgi:hypothetical protein